jgi:hypothetical protein
MNSLANSTQTGTLLLWLVILLAAAGLFVVGSRLTGDHPGPPPSSGTRDPGSAAATRQEPGPRRPPSIVWIWWATLVLLVVWNLLASLHEDRAPIVARIPYSVFIDQVRSGNVSKVAITGSEIVGKLRQSREWNPGTGLLTTTPPTAVSQVGPNQAAPEPTPMSSRTKNQGTSAPRAGPEVKPVQVRSFATVFPSSWVTPPCCPC